MKLSFKLLFTILLVVVLIAFVLVSTTFGSQARIMPLIIGVPVLLLALWQLFLELREPANALRKQHEVKEEAPASHRHALAVYAWTLAMFGALYLVGFVVTTFFYPLLYMRFVGHRSWRLSASISLGALAFLYIVMIVGLNVDLFDGVIVVALRKAIAGY